MSANSKCYLPNDIRAKDLVTAIAYLCGAKRIRTESGRAFWAGVDMKEVSANPKDNNVQGNRKVYVLPTHDMQYFEIQIAPTNHDNIWHMGSLFLYPQDGRSNRILLYAGVNEFWWKVERALVDFFGGEIDYDDCDSVDIDYKRRKPRKHNAPSDGDDWDNFQEGLLNLPKLFEFVEEE